MLRFAPSPNGPLHLGHALSALANERMAHALGRPLTLRIEDIDAMRSREAFVEAIVADLAWLGIAWAEPMRRQSQHFDLYRNALARLARDGLVYPSFATRREIAEAARRLGTGRDPDGAPRFAGDEAILGAQEAAKRRESAEPAAFRLAMARALERVGVPSFVEVDLEGASPRKVRLDAAAWGDVVLARKDVPTSYHLAVVTDDAVQSISHVVRGRDLLAATAVHRVLQRLLELPAPTYHHHALVLGPDGRKLSKSQGASSLAALREGGVSAGEVRERLASLLTSDAEDREP